MAHTDTDAPRLEKALRDMTERFRRAGVETPALDARVLVLHVLGITHARLIGEPDMPLGAGEIARLGIAEKRRLAGEPVSRIVGMREFHGREFIITPAVLDPRPETETLVEAALAAARLLPASRGPLRIADVGTGSGAILLTLLAELPEAVGVGIDISSPALDVARKNALRLGVEGRLLLVRGSWLEAAGGPFDLVVSNPPYIPRGDMSTLPKEVARHDPALALDGGENGLAAYRALANQAAEAVAEGGFVLLETGAGQAAQVQRLFIDSGFAVHPELASPLCDLAGIERVVALTEK